MVEPGLCVVLSICARSAGYLRWVSLPLVWYSLCGFYQMGELALSVVHFTCARSVGYTRWVSPCFVWFFLFVHVVQVTPDK